MDNGSREAFDPATSEAKRGSGFEYTNSELVFGIVCAVGGNYKLLQSELIKDLKLFGYDSIPIRISQLIKEARERLSLKEPLLEDSEYTRIMSHMDVGNSAREKSNMQDLLALAAVSQINQARTRTDGTTPEPKPRHAYILATLKRPEEVDLLRKIYGAGFFLIGVYASEHERKRHLINDSGLSDVDATKLIRKDEEDEHPFGQKTRETFHRSDVFIRMAEGQYKNQLKRFLDILFRHPYTTPTPDEHSMFIAQAASLRSAQLGRQVGACLMTSRGDLAGVGCNEVPRAGGGSYWPGEHDYRDHQMGYDSNDREKERIAGDIVRRLPAGAGERELAAIKKSILFDITEFGRAVHAEMDALLSCARSGISTAGTVLYTTTFPCHNCARHIVAAGVKRVVFIEPYPKSKAKELHDDSIEIRESLDGVGEGKIPFQPFVGVGPNRYADLFSTKPAGGNSIERKIEGKTIDWEEGHGELRVPMQQISYLLREQYVADELVDLYRKASTDGRKSASLPRTA